MKMTAANNRDIDILGALPLRISGASPSKVTHTTKQMVYFTLLKNHAWHCKMKAIWYRNVAICISVHGEEASKVA